MKRARVSLKVVFLWTAAVLILAAGPARAAKYESLAPLLIELDGWQANKVEGMDMDMGEVKMIQAARTYTKDDKEINAMIMIGNSMMTQAQMQGMQNMEMETEEAKMRVTTMDGFKVSLQHSKTTSEGTVVVALEGGETQGITFIFQYKGLNEEEGLALAKQFDWKKLQKAAKPLVP
jgi:hypothetical protein